MQNIQSKTYLGEGNQLSFCIFHPGVIYSSQEKNSPDIIARANQIAVFSHVTVA